MHLLTNVHKFWCYDLNLCSPGQGRFFFFSLRTSLFDSQLLNVYRVFFCLQLDTNLSVPCLEAQSTFFAIQVVLFFFFFYWVKWKIFFSLVLFSPMEKKRKDNYRYLWQWIITIFTITQPYSCTLNEKQKHGLFYLKDNVFTFCLLCIALLWFVYAHQVCLNNLTLVILLTSKRISIDFHRGRKRGKVTILGDGS